MDNVLEVLLKIWEQKQIMVKVLQIWAYSIAIASFIIKLTPTVRDDHILKKVIKFVGKIIALDKYGPPKEVDNG